LHQTKGHRKPSIDFIGADRIHRPILLHTYWWKDANGILALLQLAQMAPGIVLKIED
jgi:hypothetical protein